MIIDRFQRHKFLVKYRPSEFAPYMARFSFQAIPKTESTKPFKTKRIGKNARTAFFPIRPTHLELSNMETTHALVLLALARLKSS